MDSVLTMHTQAVPPNEQAEWSLQQLSSLVQPACQEFGVKELSLFGSRARGDARDESDFDFIVLFDRAKIQRRSDSYFGLLFFLEDSLASSINLLEQEAIRNPYFLDAIEKDRRVIYGI